MPAQIQGTTLFIKSASTRPQRYKQRILEQVQTLSLSLSLSLSLYLYINIQMQRNTFYYRTGTLLNQKHAVRFKSPQAFSVYSFRK